MSDVPLRATAVFTPEAVASINRAFAQAVATLGAANHQETRVKLAEHMMFLARNGEADEQRLCRLAVVAVSGRAPDHKAAIGARHPSNGGV